MASRLQPGSERATLALGLGGIQPFSQAGAIVAREGHAEMEIADYLSRSVTPAAIA